MPNRHILVVAVDGLRASALGAYGNTTFGTPELDELAAASFLCDSCLAPAADLPAVYRALWQSVHPLRTDSYAGGAATLPRVLAARGYQSTLVTDAADVAALSAAAGYDECVEVSGDGAVRVPDASQTALARLTTEACDIVAKPFVAPQFLWIHASGMYGPWDAPIAMQESLRDEDDPPPVESIAPPDLSIAAGDDPDTAFRYGVAYAAQVMVLDACWEALRDAVASSGANGEWLVMLLGVRGFPLGEHRRVGGVDSRLYAEQLHVPWLLQFPDGTGRLARSGRLVSPLDLLPTLVDWLGGETGAQEVSHGDGRSVLPLIRSGTAAWRDALLFGSCTSDERATRTPGWSLRYDEHKASRELFVRPDDRWEANDVAALCPDVVEGLFSATETIAVRIQSGQPMPEEPLTEELRQSVG